MATNAAQTALDIRNRRALFAWSVMAIWMAMLVGATWLMARDGPQPSQPAWLQYGALAFFWLMGLPFSGYLFSLPCTRLRVAADGAATLTLRTPFGREREDFPPGSIAAVAVRTRRDSDGDEMSQTVLIAADGRERMIGEGTMAATQEALAARLRTALGLA